MSNYFSLLTLADQARATGQHREATALYAEAHAMALDHRDHQEAMIPHSPIGRGDARRAVSLSSLLAVVLMIAGCGSGSKSAPAPEQLWPDGLYRVSAGGYVAHFSIAGPAVAVNGRDVDTDMRRYTVRGAGTRWEQVGTHGGVTFAIRSGLKIRLTHDGRSVTVTAQRVSSNG